MDRLSISEASLPLLRVKHLFPEGVVDNSHHNLPLAVKPQGNRAVLVIMDQIRGTVNGIEDPEGIPRHGVKPLFLSKKLDIRRQLMKLFGKEFLNACVHLRHIIRRPLYFDMVRHIPVQHQPLRLSYQFHYVLNVHHFSSCCRFPAYSRSISWNWLPQRSSSPSTTSIFSPSRNQLSRLMPRVTVGQTKNSVSG